jgi:hypothetical protein
MKKKRADNHDANASCNVSGVYYYAMEVGKKR